MGPRPSFRQLLVGLAVMMAGIGIAGLLAAAGNA